LANSARFHDRRHSHVALLIDQGIHIKVIQEQVEHASVRTTLDVYGHLFEGIDQAAADAIDEALTA
jgi:integrase